MGTEVTSRPIQCVTAHHSFWQPAFAQDDSEAVRFRMPTPSFTITENHCLGTHSRMKWQHDAHCGVAHRCIMLVVTTTPKSTTLCKIGVSHIDEREVGEACPSKGSFRGAHTSPVMHISPFDRRSTSRQLSPALPVHSVWQATPSGHGGATVLFWRQVQQHSQLGRGEI